MKKKRSRRVLAIRRAAFLANHREPSRRDMFPDLEPSTDNFPLYQSFLEKYKMGMILDEVFRMRYYGQLYPAMETMMDILSDRPLSKTEKSDKSDAPFIGLEEKLDSSVNIPNENIDFIRSDTNDKSSPQVLASTINNKEMEDDGEEEGGSDEYYDEEYDYEYDEDSEEEQGDGEAEESEYEYEYEYEYESDGEFEDETNADTNKDGKK